MAEVRTAHTADLDASTLEAAHGLLDLAFAGKFGDHDWEHALGGVHALVYDEGELVGHGSVVQRRLVHRGRALRTGYVEGVAVHPEHQRRGHGSALMEPLERVIRAAYELGALGASDDGVALYDARGWHPWRGPTSALTPTGVVRTPDEDSIYVLPVEAELDLDGELTCDWRDGDVW
jgi:aminoglycoside 2'-N-acetyltransferase I